MKNPAVWVSLGFGFSSELITIFVGKPYIYCLRLKRASNSYLRLLDAEKILEADSLDIDFKSFKKSVGSFGFFTSGAQLTRGVGESCNVHATAAELHVLPYSFLWKLRCMFSHSLKGWNKVTKAEIEKKNTEIPSRRMLWRKWTFRF